MVGAHPDDEDAVVLAYLSRNRRARGAYLSLTRGEGGQNLLGAERNEILGVIRTRELVAAREIDGAEQYFTRAIDFGYSKSAEDSLAKWGHDEVLGDVVWIIRRFRPDVLVRIFTGTPADVHGHHQASALLAAEGFEAASDPRRFPEQLGDVEPWRATRLLQAGSGGAPPGSAIEIDASKLDPLERVPCAIIARRGQAKHRSQGFDSPARRVPPRYWLTHLAGEPAFHDIFDGIDTTWNRLAGGAAVDRLLDEAVSDFNPKQPEKTVPLLVKARRLVAEMDHPWARVKLREMEEALARCCGLNPRAVSQTPYVVPGARIDVSVGGMARTVTVTAPEDQPYSQPYWLRQPHGPYLYTVGNREMLGLAESPAPLSVQVPLEAGGTEVELTMPVAVTVAPPVSVRIPEPVHVFPDGNAKRVEVVLRSHAALSGVLALEAPSGWAVEPASRGFTLEAAGQDLALPFQVSPPRDETRAELNAVATVGEGQIACGVVEAGYPDLPPQPVLVPARTIILRTDVRTLARNVGYIMGPGDEVPNALWQMGCDVTLLGEEDLAQLPLERFDAIVSGVRAFNVRGELRANRDRLLTYVHAGGTWVVQYNVADRRAPEQVAAIGPYPLRVGRGRVASADAPVTFLDPGHPLLNIPNRLDERDFHGWLQERGLYFAAEWDPRYTPLVECHDPGEEPLKGAMLYARHGAGAYVFTAFSLFRQLPAGVAGAYRILANLVSAGKPRP